VNRSSRALINAIYIGSIILVSLFIPVAILMGTLGTYEQTAGIIATLLSFIILIGYVYYTLILGYRNS
jgi:hypothetical protein